MLGTDRSVRHVLNRGSVYVDFSELGPSFGQYLTELFDLPLEVNPTAMMPPSVQSSRIDFGAVAGLLPGSAPW